MPLTEKNRSILLAVAVVLMAVGVGYVIGKRPAEQAPAATQAPTKQRETGTPTAPSASSALTTKGGTTAPAPTATEPVAAPAQKGTISLAAKAGNGGIAFNWSTPSNLTAPYGFYLYKSVTSSPSFPRDEAKHVADPSARTFTWDIQDGSTAYFRVCTWNGKAGAQSACLTTSNAVKATAPSGSAQASFDYTASELGLAGRPEQDGVRLFWSMTTLPDFKSYQIVRSAIDTNPYYPKTTSVVTSTDKMGVSGIDMTAVRGVKYFYRVCVVRSGGVPQCGNVWSITY